jgi:hypothetical protein
VSARTRLVKAWFGQVGRDADRYIMAGFAALNLAHLAFCIKACKGRNGAAGRVREDAS